MKNIKFLFAVVGLVGVLALSAAAQRNVNFTSIDGEKIELESQKGKIVVMAIGASWLPLSKDQAVAINKLSRKYAGRDVIFYFIATDSSVVKSKNYASDEVIRKFAQDNKISVSILRDSDGAQTIKDYKIDQLPAYIILDKQGKLAAGPFSGADSKSDISVTLSQKIDAIL